MFYNEDYEVIIMEKGLMTEGNIWKQLILFSIPLLLGNLFQQLYNAVDSVIVGQFVSSQALAAVGSSFPLINLLISFFMGLSLGAGVVVSKYFGARDIDNMRKSIHSSIVITFIIGVIMTFVGILACPIILRWMQTPSDVINDSIVYLQIYFGGILFTMIYNIGSGILRAVGDTKRPLYFLIICSIINIILDLLFIIFFKMRIAGAAYATVISQAISAILTMLLLINTSNEYKISFKELKLYREQTKEIIRVGIPSGIQNAVVAISNVIVQSNINSFDWVAMAGCSACQKLDGFAIMPVLSFSMAFTTFTGQNIGAKRYDRVKQGAKIGLILSLSTIICISATLLYFDEQLLSIFSDDPEVIKYGLMMMHTLIPMYFLLTITHALNGIIRGAGKTKVPMLVMIVCWCCMRMAWILTTVPLFNDIQFVFYGWPITWAASSLWLIIYYCSHKWLPEAYQKQS